MRESAKPKEENPLIAEVRKKHRYPEIPKGVQLAEGVWDRKGEEPVNR